MAAMAAVGQNTRFAIRAFRRGELRGGLVGDRLGIGSVNETEKRGRVKWCL